MNIRREPVYSRSTLISLNSKVYVVMPYNVYFKGTETLVISMFFMKELYEPWILLLVSSKSVEKYGSYERLNIANGL